MAVTWRAWHFALALFILLIGIVWVTRITWMEAMGRFLVNTEPPEHADMIVVLGGDWNGNRILKAAELARQGFAPKVMISGGGYLYGNYEGDLAVPFAVRHGYDEKLFIKLLYPATSTRDEAEAVVREMRRLGVKKYIIVTTEFHTRRATNIFRKLAPDLEVRTVAPPDTLHWNNWWTEREGRKTFLLEWTKTVTSMVGM